MGKLLVHHSRNVFASPVEQVNNLWSKWRVLFADRLSLMIFSAGGASVLAGDQDTFAKYKVPLSLAHLLS